MKIGIYGGTFDPPHLGHMEAARAAAALLELDRVLFIPASIPPHKALPPDTVSAQDRLAMTAMMADGVCLELGRPGLAQLVPDGIFGEATLEAVMRFQREHGLAVTGRGIVREHQDIYLGDRLAGQTTSGTHAPFLGKAIAMAYLSPEDAAPGTAVEVDVRGRRVPCKVVELPFYKR